MEEAPELEKRQAPHLQSQGGGSAEGRDTVELDGLEAWQKPVDIPNEDVDAEVERLRQQHAEIQVPDPMRPAAEGDLDHHRLHRERRRREPRKTSAPRAAGRDQRRAPAAVALKEGLLGMQPGRRKDRRGIEFEDDHPNEDLQGKTASFSITAKDLHEKLLPGGRRRVRQGLRRLRNAPRASLEDPRGARSGRRSSGEKPSSRTS